MTFNRLMWIFAGLFLLFGLPLLLVEDKSWVRVLISLSCFSLGGFALAMAADGLVRGKIKFQFSLIKRQQQPLTYWAAIGLVFAAGIGVIITAIWAAFFKTW
jgi:hypothetical protein